MPHHSGNVTIQNVARNGARMTYLDSKGGKHSQFIPTSGGAINGNAHRDLAVAIAETSNAFLLSYGKSQETEWRVSDAKYFDEAFASVNSMLVIVFKHDTDPYRSREVIIPAIDAQFILADGVTPDLEHAKIQDVITKAQAILNDDGSGTNPGDYHTYYGYLTTRKASKTRRSVNLNLPRPVEPGLTDSPDGEPDSVPVV